MPMVNYDSIIEDAVATIAALLTQEYRFSYRAMALLLLQGDLEATSVVRLGEPAYKEIIEITNNTAEKFSQPLNYIITMYRQQVANQILEQTVYVRQQGRGWSEYLSYLTMWPVTGIPILALVLYFGMYKFVGQFGAGVIVDYLETVIFGDIINPLVNNVLDNYFSSEIFKALIGGEYGIITLGLRYAIAIVLPIVGSFFIAFSIFEDTGYLPRLAMLADRIFKVIGLNGRALLPVTLGFGCGTMATIVTRTLETRRERLIATFLLALAIPCSAQLGLIMGMLSAKPKIFAVWAMIISGTFMFCGVLAARLVPGHRPVFYMELPPLRMPNLSNVFAKSYMRMRWYFWEILPLFVAASCLIWIGKITGGFNWLMHALAPLVRALGLPAETAKIFIFGFFRRDYGAAGLYDLIETGWLNTEQLLITATVLTLFVPCIAQFAVMVKERGWCIALSIALFVFPFAFAVGYILHCMLTVWQILF